MAPGWLARGGLPIPVQTRVKRTQVGGGGCAVFKGPVLI